MELTNASITAQLAAAAALIAEDVFLQFSEEIDGIAKESIQWTGRTRVAAGTTYFEITTPGGWEPSAWFSLQRDRAGYLGTLSA